MFELLGAVLFAGTTVSPIDAGTLVSSSPFVIPAIQPGFSGFGSTSVANAGDVNGDGFTDIIVGAYLADNGEMDEGRAYVYLGGPSGFPATPAWSAESDQADAWFGFSVAGAGDVNADGFADVIVGAFRYTNGQVNEGRAYLYLGSSSGLGTSPAWITESDRSGALYGISVASAGDVNADGYGDVIVTSQSGGAYAYHGSAEGLSTSPAWMRGVPGTSLLRMVAGAGDVNGDGYDDVIVSEHVQPNGQLYEGAVSVHLGSDTGLSPTPAWSAEGDQVELFSGQYVAAAGDVNADGFGDVVVGTYQFDGGLTDIGKAWLYLGSDSGPEATPAWTAVGDADRAWFGWDLAAAGDIDGDGYADVAVSARNYSGFGGIGRAYVYRGTATGLESAPAWDTGIDGGATVGISGDLNGDGLGDVLIGSGGVHIYLSCLNGPIANAGPDQRFRLPKPVTFDGSGTQSGNLPLTYDWDVDGDGLADASGPIITHSYVGPGTYTVTLTVTDAYRCADTDALTVTTRGNPHFAP